MEPNLIWYLLLTENYILIDDIFWDIKGSSWVQIIIGIMSTQQAWSTC